MKVSGLNVMHFSHAASAVPTDMDEQWNPTPTFLIIYLPSASFFCLKCYCTLPSFSFHN